MKGILKAATAIIQSLSEEELNRVDKSVCKTVKTITEKFIEKDMYQDGLYLKSKYKA